MFSFRLVVLDQLEMKQWSEIQRYVVKGVDVEREKGFDMSTCTSFQL
jgi:hypothetical protein